MSLGTLSPFNEISREFMKEKRLKYGASGVIIRPYVFINASITALVVKGLIYSPALGL